MSFGSTKTAPKTKAVFNVDADSTNSNQEAVPVKYACGRNRIAVDWLGPAYGRTVKKVKSASGGKGSENQTAGHKYYASFLASICVCNQRPVDALTLVLVDQQEAWKGRLTRGGSDYYSPVTLKDHGEMRLYWGREDQPAMDWFPTHFDGTTADENTPAQPSRTDVHPPYGGVAYIALKQFYLGQDRTQAPTIELVVERAPAWFAGETPADVTERGSNAVAILYELLTDDLFGVGLDPARLDKPSWLSAYAAADAAGHRLSPLITGASNIRTLVAQLMEYYDGWLRRDGDRLATGFWRHGDTDTSGLVTLNDDDFTAEPELKSAGLAGSINQVQVVWRDPDHYFHDTPVPRFDPANYRLTGDFFAETVQRPWIVNRDQAAAYAGEYLYLKSQPVYSGPLEVRRERVSSRLAGDLVKVSSAAYGETIICRILEIGYPEDRSGVARLRVESERGLYPVLYIPVPPPRVPDFLVVATRIEEARAWRLPSGLTTSAAPQLCLLAERPDPTLTGFRAYVSRDAASYDLILGDCLFAVRGILSADAGAGDAEVTVQIDGVDADLVASQSDSARDDHTLLCVLDDEVASVGEVQALGAGTYGVTLVRGIYGSAVPGTHPTGLAVWFVFRAAVNRAERAGTIERGVQVYFKLPTHNAVADQDLADAYVLAAEVPDASAVGLILNLHVETEVDVATDGRLLSEILLFWDAPPDQGIIGFEAAVRPAAGTEDDWTYQSCGTPQASFQVQPGLLYLVKVRAHNDADEWSAWTDPVEVTSATASRFSVTGLELANGYGGAHTFFYGQDAKIQWRLNSPLRAEEIGQEGPEGVTDGTYDPLFADYEFGVFDLTDGEQVYSHLKANPKTTFTFEQNAECPGGPRAAFRVGVRARDRNGGVSPWAYLDISNPPPAAPTNLIVAHTGFQANHLIWADAIDLDIKKTEVRSSPTSNYEDSTVAGAVRGDTNYFAHTGLKQIRSLFYWIRHKDSYGNYGASYPPADQPGLQAVMGGIIIGTGSTQTNLDLDGNLWQGADGYNNAPLRFTADGQIYVGIGGNSTIDPGAINVAAIKSPKLVPDSTSFDASIDVMLLSKTAGADIIYTLDGSTPSPTNGTWATNGATIHLAATTTVKAIARKLGTASNDGGRTGGAAVRERTYTLAAGACADPTVSPPGGTFAPAQFPLAVTLSCATAGATLRWSTSSMPASATGGNAYTGPVPVSSGQTLYSRAFASGKTPGPGRTDAYAQLQDSWNGGGGGSQTYDPPTPPGANVP